MSLEELVKQRLGQMSFENLMLSAKLGETLTELARVNTELEKTKRELEPKKTEEKPL